MRLETQKNQKSDPLVLIRASLNTEEECTILASIEISLGCLMHSFRLPFPGHILAAHQAFYLSVLQQEHKETLMPIRVSVIVGLVKFLSIATKRLSPAVGIAIQGMLFSFATAVFGMGFLGRWIGTFLMLAWCSLHSLLIITFMGVFTTHHPMLLLIKGGTLWFAALLALIAVIIALLSSMKQAAMWPKTLQTLSYRFTRPRKKRPHLHPLAGAFTDLLNPLISLGILLTGFAFWRDTGICSIWFQKMGLLLLTFYFMRVLFRFFPAEKVGSWLMAKLPESWRLEASGVLRNL